MYSNLNVMYLILSQKMIGKDTRTCRQEAKRGQCLPGFDCFERNHPSLDAHMSVWDSLNQLQQERRGSGPDAVQIS